ncbi:MAG: hypothetical protein HN919_20620 [Verrucomicrobia bacterium]|jgi:hypothetical protein|nr:hypothetical protein [Verrucomicrobiota bacterium]MBT7068710.1 hypothetical protein [Verrucomicrobiota bacterium]MBT7701000.1 hypothetical protein [Verrucomicrobiota bacterium]
MTASYLFKLRFTLLPLCAMLSLAPASTASAGQMAGPPASLVSLADPEGWFASVAYINSDRQVRFGDTVTDVDFNRVIAATGVTVLPFLDLRVEAGWVTADMGVAEGEGGLEWGVGARAAIWEYIIEGTPALPRRRALRVEADVAYHAGRSNFETDFEWTALTVSPLLRYTHDRTTEAVWHHRHATGLAAYAGFQYSDWSVDFGTLTGEGNRDFGLRLGADVRVASGWLTQLDAVLYDGSDRRLTIGMGYTF